MRPLDAAYISQPAKFPTFFLRPSTIEATAQNFTTVIETKRQKAGPGMASIIAWVAFSEFQ